MMPLPNQPKSPPFSALKVSLENVLASSENSEAPVFSGVAKILENKNTDIRLFGKPTSRPYRRMGVVLLNGEIDANMEQMRKDAAELARQITVN